MVGQKGNNVDVASVNLEMGLSLLTNLLHFLIFLILHLFNVPHLQMVKLCLKGHCTAENCTLLFQHLVPGIDIYFVNISLTFQKC